MKLIRKANVLMFIILVLLAQGSFVYGKSDNTFDLTSEEKIWLSKNRDKTFVLGADPLTGYEYFNYNGETKGYLIKLIGLIEKDLGLKIKLDTSMSWGEVFSSLQNGSIDILFGANDTPERREYMAFTQPISKNPYVIIAKKGANIHTVSDIDKKAVGFIKNDVVIDILPDKYKNIKYKEVQYHSQVEAITALRSGNIDAFITSGGPVIYDYIYRYPELTNAFKFNTITSDMTFSTRKEDKILAGILNKEINYLSKGELAQIVSQSETEYYLKIMNLTPNEKEWLKNHGTAIVGVTKDYLPFDYCVNGDYKGISGQIIKEISRKTGIKFINYYDEFDNLHNKLAHGGIDILNIAKTDERMKYILYPQPYSLERDIIIGKKDKRDVKDVFGLEGKKIAVIKGFWHYEHLKKNLTSVNIIETDSIQESLELVNEGKADYLIENPSVAKYYIEELELYDLVEKGVTSTDSYLYYGISSQKPELASIIDKVLPLLDIEELFKTGYEEVPHKNNNQYLKKLVVTIVGLCLLLVLIIIFVVKLFNDLIKKKTEVELLRQRENFLYMDALTELYNSNYYIIKLKDNMNLKQFPQTIIVCDINNLKTVNDNYGHYVGDELLKLFASILKQTCPEDSTICRMGGDEFYIIVENKNELQAQEIIDNIRNLTMIKSIAVGNEAIHAASAMGYATRYSRDIDFGEIIKIADQKMYCDKKGI